MAVSTTLYNSNNYQVSIQGDDTQIYWIGAKAYTTIPTTVSTPLPDGVRITDTTGASGASGPTGPLIPPGPITYTGATGATGPQGDPGGPSGPTGPSGPSGPHGSTGPSGVIGPVGITGATGPLGLSGPKGATGSPGTPGATGPKGATGAPGPATTIGATGATGPGAGSPGGSTTDIQFNNAGAFGGDPNLTWTTGASGSGIVNKNRLMIGSHASLTEVTYAPGDPTLGSVSAYIPNLGINDYLSGDLTVGRDGLEALTMYTGYKHTGTAKAFSDILDIEPIINTDSTGPWGSFDCLYLGPQNMGSGNIDNAHTLICSSYYGGTGTITNHCSIFVGPNYSQTVTAGYGVYIRYPRGGKGVNTTGLYIEDHTGSGTGTCYNMHSVGAASVNLFDGNILAQGIAAIGSNSDLTQVTSAPGDPVNAYTSAYHATLTSNNYVSGDLSGHGWSSLAAYPGFKHTGTAGTGTLYVLDANGSVNSDSTGPLNYLIGINCAPNNYGSGNIANIIGVSAYPWAGNTTGTITNMYGVQVVNGYDQTTTNGWGVLIGKPTGTHAVNAVGLEVDDHTGVGSTSSCNIWSKGASSIVKLDGITRMGTATNTTPQDGDLWFDGTNLKFRIGGVTKTVTLT
jgi:hypothetical protein